jgi:hypothetical protein
VDCGGAALGFGLRRPGKSLVLVVCRHQVHRIARRLERQAAVARMIRVREETTELYRSIAPPWIQRSGIHWNPVVTLPADPAPCPGPGAATSRVAEP